VGGIRPDVPLEQSWLATAFPAQSWSALLLMVCTLVGIPCLSCVKDKHPWNLIATWLWSTLLAVFLAAADIPDAYAPYGSLAAHSAAAARRRASPPLPMRQVPPLVLAALELRRVGRRRRQRCQQRCA